MPFSIVTFVVLSRVLRQIGQILFVRHSVTKTIDQHFDRLGEIGKKQIDLGYVAASTQLQKKLAIYPAVSELVYRAKTATDAMRAAMHPVGLLNDEFTEACRTLTTELRDWRLFLPKDLFDLLHEYKHALQDLNVIKDTVTRPGNPDVGAELPAGTKERIADLCDRTGHSAPKSLTNCENTWMVSVGP